MLVYFLDILFVFEVPVNALYSLIAKEALSKRLDELSQCLNIPARLLDAEGNQLEQHGETGAYCALLKARAFCDCVRTYLKAGRIACEPGESQVFSCHAGLNHIAFSLVRRKQLLGTVIVGPFRMDAPQSMPLSGLADKRRLTPPLCPDLYDELQKLPVITPARVHSISCLMDDLFAPLLSDARLLMQERQEKLCRQSVINETVQHYKGTPTDSMCTLIYQKECDLLGKVKQCDIQGARRVLNELLSFVLLAQGQDLQWIRTRACELTILLSRIAIEGGAPPDRILSLNPKYLEQLQKDESYEDLCFSLKEIVENFIQTIALPGAAQAHPVVRRAVQYITDHFDQPLSIQSLADELEVSPSYFSALFSKCMGIGFHEYLTRFRVEEARQLLTATQYPINEIAVTVGYADQSSFTKAFKRVTGITPYQLRT